MRPGFRYEKRKRECCDDGDQHPHHLCLLLVLDVLDGTTASLELRQGSAWSAGVRLQGAP
jgi:hypothetical protein